MAEQHKQFPCPSPALLESALQSLDTSVAVLAGPELRYTFANAAYERAAPVHPVIGRTFREVFAADAKAGAEERLRHVLESGEPWHVETYQAPGRPEPSFWEGEVVRTHAPGEPPSIVILVRDVTDRAIVEQALVASDEALRRANAKLNRTLASITDGTVVLDRDWRYTVVSERAAKILSMRREQMLGSVVWDVFPKARGSAFDLAAHRALSTGEPQRFDGYFPPPNELWLECDCYPTDGELTIHFRDITERKQSEQRARQAIERYERQVRLFDGVASTTPDFVYLFDLQGRYLYANRRLLDVWGMKLTDVIGKTPRQLGYEPWLHDQHLREIAQVIASRKAVKGEAPFKAERTGIFGIYEYIFTPVLGPDGTVEIIAGTSRDVTERKRAEDALRRSEALFRGTFENTAVGMAHMSTDGRWLRVNEALCRITGHSREALLGNALGSITHPDDAAEDHARSQELLAGETSSYSLEKRFIRPDGSPIWVNVTVTLDTEPATGGKYFIKVVEDISGRRAVEERLAEALRVRDDFLSIAGHELKTPLATLLLQVQTLARTAAKERWGARASDRLERAAASGLRLENLINQLLDVSRITAGRVQLEPEHLRLGDVLHTVVERFEESAAKAGCRLDMQIDDELEAVADRLRVEQIATNLLSNALKYGKGAPVEIELSGHGDTVLLRVVDHGIGIPPDQQRRIFERFEHAVATREYGGFGLGLWIVRQLVELMGGTIWVESVVGKGATFCVELPLWAAKVERHELH
jgi:PAS domain S-box-containing protein